MSSLIAQLEQVQKITIELSENVYLKGSSLAVSIAGNIVCGIIATIKVVLAARLFLRISEKVSFMSLVLVCEALQSVLGYIMVLDGPGLYGFYDAPMWVILFTLQAMLAALTSYLLALKFTMALRIARGLSHVLKIIFYSVSFLFWTLLVS